MLRSCIPPLNVGTCFFFLPRTHVPGFFSDQISFLLECVAVEHDPLQYHRFPTNMPSHLPGDVLRLGEAGDTYVTVLSATPTECIVSTKSGRTMALYGQALENARRFQRGPTLHRKDRCQKRPTNKTRSEATRRRLNDAMIKTYGARETMGVVKREPHANIYVMNLGYGAFKIGRTRCVSKRIRQLKVASLQKITLAKSWKVPRASAHTLETTLKRNFANVFKCSDGGTEVFYGNVKDACRRTERLVCSGV